MCRLLEAQVRRLRKGHTFKVVVVGGSIGKTSTKLAIANTLQASHRVRYQDGNYNDRLTVPLVLFGQIEPGIFNIFAWAKILFQNEQTIRKNFAVDFAVLEIGTDGPGQIAEFAYLQPELAIITAITPEHMEFFQDLDAVAAEELEVAKFAKQLLVNSDDTLEKYLTDLHYVSYGFGAHSTYRATDLKKNGLAGQSATFDLHGLKIPVELTVLGEQGAKIALSAAAAADILGLPEQEIIAGLKNVGSAPGRMQILPGIKNSTLIDDTYNASPAAVKAALNVLYSTDAPQRIAILGSMNELGDYSQAAHEEVGSYCDTTKLDAVVTIGQMANDFLAPAAESKGCKVEKFVNPYDAASFVSSLLKDGAVVLAKGSQNGVFAEEALKPLLLNPEDASRLVRQSPNWLSKKAKQFSKSL